MVLDEKLLDQAHSSAQKVAEAERQELLARAEYHTALRRLHLAGASFREIAEAVGMSHQRVQQIVEAEGGSWWKRVWKTRRARRDAVCTFCGRPPSELEKLVAGPNCYLCDGCITAARNAMTKAGAAPRAVCSFCGKRKPSWGQGEGRVCEECLRLCEGIAQGRATP